MLPFVRSVPDNADWLPPAHGTAGSDGGRSVLSITGLFYGRRRFRTRVVRTLPHFLPLWLAAHWLHSAGCGVALAVLSFALPVALASPDRTDAPATVDIPGLSVLRWLA